MAFYEAVFILSALATSVVVGLLRTSESASRLRARGLSRRTMQAESEVRRRVAESIHDGPVQELIGLDMILSAAHNAAQHGRGDEAAGLIDEARELGMRNLASLRDEIVDLGPYAFQEISFDIAIENCLPVWKRRYGFEVGLAIERIDMPPEMRGHLFRIAQEAVVNAGRHAEAAAVSISLRTVGSQVELRVTDDGHGFDGVDPLGAGEPGHLGLASMRERAELMDGSLEIESSERGTRVLVLAPLERGRPDRLDPAALGGDQDRLCAVNRAELRVRVVEVRANRARGELELVRDLLVDLALCQTLQHLDLAVRERARVHVALGVAGALRELVHDRAKLLGREAAGAGCLKKLLRVDGLAVAVVREHVGQADESGLALGVVGVMALDCRGEPVRQRPAASEDAANESVVDAELEALLVQALLGRARRAVDLRRVAGIGVGENELADVVQERGDEELVAVLVLHLTRETVGGGLGGHRVEAEALRHQVPAGGALEEVEGGGAGGERLHAFGREHLDRLGNAGELALLALRRAVGDPEHGDHEGDVGLDRLHDLTDRGAILADHPKNTVARLGQSGECLKRLEGRREPAPVAFVVSSRSRILAGGLLDGGGGFHGHPGYRQGWTEG